MESQLIVHVCQNARPAIGRRLRNGNQRGMLIGISSAGPRRPYTNIGGYFDMDHNSVPDRQPENRRANNTPTARLALRLRLPRLLAIACLLGGITIPAFGLNPNRALTQALHRIWQIQQGLP